MKRFIGLVSLIIGMMVWSATPTSASGETISGVVTDPNGAVVVGATVERWFCVNTGGITPTCTIVATTTDAAGSYIFAGLTQARYILRYVPPVTRPNLVELWSGGAVGPIALYGGGPYTAVDVTPDGNTIADAVMPFGGIISGTVTDSAGAPVVGASVQANQLSGPMQNIGITTRTDATGRYSLVGLPATAGNTSLPSPAQYKIKVTPALGGPNLLQGSLPASGSYAISAGTVINGADLQLQYGIFGIVRLFSGGAQVPAAGFSPTAAMCVSPATWDWTSYCGGAYVVASVGAGGTSVVGPANPGTFTIRATSQLGNVNGPVFQPLVLVAGDSFTCDLPLDNSIVATCTVTHNPPPPVDTDGVSAAVEAGVNAAGDGNFDGTPDAQQSNVTSIPSAGSGGGYITIAAPTPAGISVSSVSVTDPAVVQTPPLPPLPPGGTVDAGIISYTLTGVLSASTVDVDVFFTTPTAANSYIKLQGSQWVALPASAFTIVSPTHFTLHLTDGGVGDGDGVANGIIVDPGAAATLDLTPPTIVCPAPTSVILGSAATITASVSDTGSGVASSTATASVPTSTVGATMVQVSATDLAGNSASVGCPVSVVYNVQWLLPINPGGYRSVARNTTVPVLLRLTDANSRAVLGNLHVSGLISTAVPCPAGNPTNLFSVPGNGTLAPTSIGAGFWAAGWFAAKEWRGTCRSVVIGFDDGTATATIIKVV